MNFIFLFAFIFKIIFGYSNIFFSQNLINYLTLDSEKEFTGTNYQIYSSSNGDFPGLGFIFNNNYKA